MTEAMLHAKSLSIAQLILKLATLFLIILITLELLHPGQLSARIFLRHRANNLVLFFFLLEGAFGHVMHPKVRQFTGRIGRFMII